MEALEAQQGINVDFDNLFRGLGGYFFDVHPTRFTRHEHDLGGSAIGKHTQIELLLNGQTLFHQQLLDHLALGTRLMGDQGHAKDLLSVIFDLITILRQLDATTLAAATGMDLSLNHHRKSPQLGTNALSLGDSESHAPTRNRDPVLPEQLFRLKLVNFHSSPRYPRNNSICADLSSPTRALIKSNLLPFAQVTL